ncbi:MULTISPECIES: tellurite resistance TerB family protein [Synechococcales]|uniref:tellurite resistance TerB family protein n=1 Tax=Synechococcus sp. CS-1333 TaxID=2848638 RepID=UPI0026847306|nr:tellurite resistance TerB family protein [Synechococcus sp. CS-1333]
MALASITAMTPLKAMAQLPALDVMNAMQPMDSPTAFVAVALAAVSWDGVLTKAGSRALRHALDYREPFRNMSDAEMIQLFDRLLAQLRLEGSRQLMEHASAVLDPRQRLTAFTVAAEIMRSDGELVAEEQRILEDLASHLTISANQHDQILQVMDLLHASLVGNPVLA